MTASTAFWIPFLVLVAVTILVSRGYRFIWLISVLGAGLLTHVQTHTGAAPFSLTPDFWDRWVPGGSQHAVTSAVSG